MRPVSFLLATALVAALNAQQVREELGTSYKFPNGLPDGSVLTFFVWHHTSSWWSPGYDPINIDFYNELNVTERFEFNITAHLRMERDWYYPIKSNTYLKGEWQTEVTREQPMDHYPARGGYWRVDVIKIDSKRLNVFCDGYWSDVRSFDLPLDKIRSVYVNGEWVNQDYVQIRLKLPNSNIFPLNFAQFMDWIDMTMSGAGVARKLITLPKFPIGAKIEMSVLLKASAEYYMTRPSLMFMPVGSTDFFLRILQIWKDRWHSFPSKTWTHELYMTHNDEWDSDGRPTGVTPCLNKTTLPNGDLVHMVLTRTSKQVITMKNLYKNQMAMLDPLEAKTNVTCEHEIPLEEAAQMDKPFDIMSQYAALIFHLEHTIPSPGNATMT